MSSEGMSAGSIYADVILRVDKIEAQAKKIEQKLDKRGITLSNLKVSDSAIANLAKQIEAKLNARLGGGAAVGAAIGASGGAGSAAVSGAVAARIVGGTVTATPPRSYGNPFTSPAPTGFNYTSGGKPCPACGNVNAATATFCRKCGHDFRPSFGQKLMSFAKKDWERGRYVANLGMDMVGTTLSVGRDILWGGMNVLHGGTDLARGAFQGIAGASRMGLAAGATISKMMGLGPRAPKSLDDIYNLLEVQSLAQVGGINSGLDNLGNSITSGIGLLMNQGGPRSTHPLGGTPGLGMLSGVVPSVQNITNNYYNRSRRRRPRRPGGGGGGSGWVMGAGGIALGIPGFHNRPHGGGTPLPAGVDMALSNVEMLRGQAERRAQMAQQWDDLHRGESTARNPYRDDVPESPYADYGVPDDHIASQQTSGARARKFGFRGQRRPRGGFVDIGWMRDSGRWMRYQYRMFQRSPTGRMLNTKFGRGIGWGTAASMAFEGASDFMASSNSYGMGMGVAGASGDMNLAVQTQMDHGQHWLARGSHGVLSGIPIIGDSLSRFASNANEFIYGDRKHIATMMAGASFTDAQTARMVGSKAGRLSNAAATASMGPGFANRLRSIDLGFQSRGISENYAINQNYAAEDSKVQALRAAKDDAGANALQSSINRRREADRASLNANLAAQQRYAMNAATGEHWGTLAGHRASMGALTMSGVNDFAAGKMGIMGQYAPGIANAAATGDWGAVGRMTSQGRAAVDAYTRDWTFQTGQMHAGNKVGAMMNASAFMGAAGFSHASTMAGFAAQRAGAGVNLRGNLRGVQDWGRRAAIYGDYWNQLGAINAQQAAYTKEFGFQQADLGFAVQGGAAALRGDVLGSQLAGINAGRNRLSGLDPSMRAGAGRLLDFQEYEARAGERGRSLARDMTNNSIYTSAKQYDLLAENKQFAAEIAGISGDTQNEIHAVMNDPSLTTDQQRQARIAAIRKRAESRLGLVKKNIADAATGGTAIGLGNSINFAGMSSRSSKPMENLDDAMRAADAAVRNAGRDAGVVSGRSAAEQKARDAAAGKGGDDRKMDLNNELLGKIFEKFGGMAKELASLMGMQ